VSWLIKQRCPFFAFSDLLTVAVSLRIMDLAVKKDDEVDGMDNDQLVAAMLRAKNERRRAESDVSTVVVGFNFRHDEKRNNRQAFS
jgi:hypothetical protein